MINSYNTSAVQQMVFAFFRALNEGFVPQRPASRPVPLFIMKTCQTCSETKDESLFRSGSKCKKCSNKRAQELRIKKNYNRSPARLANGRRSAQKYYYKNREKAFARYRCRNAVRRGLLLQLPCEVCGSNERIEAHHEDYSKPLEVKWLCKKHHAELHYGKLTPQSNGQK